MRIQSKFHTSVNSYYESYTVFHPIWYLTVFSQLKIDGEMHKTSEDDFLKVIGHNNVTINLCVTSQCRHRIHRKRQRWSEGSVGNLYPVKRERSKRITGNNNCLVPRYANRQYCKLTTHPSGDQKISYSRHAIYHSIHYDDVIMTMLASQITSLTVVYSIVYSGVNQRKHQSSASLAFVREIHRGPVNFPHKWPVTRKMFPFDDVIMYEM